MKAVLQRASGASVAVGGQVVGSFEGEGLVALVGVHREDEEEDATRLANRIAALKILDGERSVTDRQAPVLVISQFTLYGRTRKGTKPSWSDAAPSAQAEPLVAKVVSSLRARELTVYTGVFGAMMEVTLTNSGPFTVIVDTRAPK